MIPVGKTAEETLLFIKALAVDKASQGICITDATKPGNPLIYVNKGFISMTEYTENEVIGKNCRFLQGSTLQHDKIARIREAINKKQYVQEEIVNFKKSGQPFWNRLSITPVFQGRKLLFFVGIQEDITAKKEREELDRQIANRNLILRTTLIAEQKQRSYTGAELHDNINQLLAAAKMYFTMAIRQEPKRLEMLKEGSNILDNAISEIRTLSKKFVNQDNIKPLESSIRDLIDKVLVASSFKIEFTFEQSLEDAILPDCKIAMFRILQEQVNNIYKYAECSKVTINVFKDAEFACLSVKDNGKGFDTAVESAGIGIKNMTSRTEAEGGTFFITSEIGKGTEIMAMFPLYT